MRLSMVPRTFYPKIAIILCGLAGTAVAQPLCPDRWAPGMGVPGTSDRIWAMKQWDPDGAGPRAPVVALGGWFTMAGKALANHVAIWDGTEFSALGAGVGEGGIGCFEIDRDGKLVTAARWNGLNTIATWDGSTWTYLGSGTDGYLNSILRDYAGNLVVGGSFLHAGGVPSSNVAMWNGTAWQPMGAGVPREALNVVRGPNNSIIAYCYPGSLWSWNGTSWSDITSPHADIYGIATLPDNDVIVTGVVNGVPEWARRWDGNSFTGMGLRSTNSVGEVQVLSDGSIYVNGVDTTTPSGNTIHGIATYVNGEWIEAVRVDTTSVMVEKLQGRLILGGAISNNFERPWNWNNFAVRDGDNTGAWRMVGDGFDYYYLSSICVLADGRIVVGGGFSSVNGAVTRTIAVFDGNTWSALGEGLQGGRVESIVQMSDGSIVACGSFSMSGSTPVHGVARWDGTSWQPMGNGFPGSAVNVLAAGANGSLYVSGGFTLSDGLARWDGTAWVGVGTGIVGDVYAMHVHASGDLIVGGNFHTAGGLPASNIARWNGVAWTRMWTGIGGTLSAVYTITSDANGMIYVGGKFTVAGGISAQGVAKWNGASWSAVGSGLNGDVNSLAFDTTGKLVASGRFVTVPGGRIVRSVARFDGTAWQQLGDPAQLLAANTLVKAIRPLADGRFCVIGDFNNFGSTISRSIAFLGPGMPPEIEGQPADVFACLNSPVEFHIDATGPSPISYQWRKNDIDISPAANPSAATATLQLPSVSTADIANYSCRVSNGCGDTLSDRVDLSMCAADFNCDGTVDFFDYLDFVDAFSSLEDNADFNGDSIVDFFDYLDFVDAFSVGC